MFGLKRLSGIASAAVFATGLAFGGGPAHAAPCQTGAVTLNNIDGNPFGPVSANQCAGSIGGNLSDGVLATQLNAGAFFGLGSMTWSWLGKDEKNAPAGPVSADWGQKTGSWSANFTPNKVDAFVVLLKGSTSYSVFLFNSFAPPAGSIFAGLFDMTKSGIVVPGPSGNNPDLSHLDVAGVYVATVIPLPAAVWLMIAGLGGLGLVARRKAKNA